MSHQERVLATGCGHRDDASFLRALEQFEDHRERGPVRQTALRSDRVMAHSGEGAFDGFGGPQVFPVLGWEVVESQQRVAILAQAVGRLLVFQRVALHEGVERQLGGGLGFGHPDLLQRALGFRLLALWQLGEHVRGLVHRAALLARSRPDLAGGFPESVQKGITDTERAISSLTTLRVHEHISHDEFIAERQKLEKEQLRLKQLVTYDKTGEAFEPLRALVSFSNRAFESFRAGDIRTKRLILSSVGSNLSLNDKTLTVQAKKPLLHIAELSNPTQLRSAVNDIRTL